MNIYEAQDKYKLVGTIILEARLKKGLGDELVKQVNHPEFSWSKLYAVEGPGRDGMHTKSNYEMLHPNTIDAVANALDLNARDLLYWSISEYLSLKDPNFCKLFPDNNPFFYHPKAHVDFEMVKKTYKLVGDMIREARTQSGLSQAELVEMVNAPQFSEHLELEFSLETLQKIEDKLDSANADALQVLEKIFGMKEDELIDHGSAECFWRSPDYYLQYRDGNPFANFPKREPQEKVMVASPV